MFSIYTEYTPPIKSHQFPPSFLLTHLPPTDRLVTPSTAADLLFWEKLQYNQLSLQFLPNLVSD